MGFGTNAIPTAHGNLASIALAACESRSHTTLVTYAFGVLSVCHGSLMLLPRTALRTQYTYNTDTRPWVRMYSTNQLITPLRMYLASPHHPSHPITTRRMQLCSPLPKFGQPHQANKADSCPIYV